MRNTTIILFIFTFALLSGGCNNIVKSSADEVLAYSWSVENPAGINAKLSFDVELNTASLVINDNSSDYEIYGTFAIDDDKIYIISHNLNRIYEFSYKVYENRLELTFKNETISFIKNKPQ